MSGAIHPPPPNRPSWRGA